MQIKAAAELDELRAALEAQHEEEMGLQRVQMEMQMQASRHSTVCLFVDAVMQSNEWLSARQHKISTRVPARRHSGQYRDGALYKLFAAYCI